MEKLVCPVEFPFPFTPYPIQLDFMKSLYTALEEGKLGIFESPTGTGKSLSLICGALTWLLDHERNERRNLDLYLRTLDESLSSVNTSLQKIDSSDWLNQQAEEVVLRQKKNSAKMKMDALDKYATKISKLKLASTLRKRNIAPNKPLMELKTYSNPARTIEVSDTVDQEGEDDLLLDESETISNGNTSDEEESEDDVENTKIFFCSRTHSQLAQFIGEIQRSSFGSEVRVVPLASRQNYCINKEVSRLKSLSLINERCLDLQRKNHKATQVSDDGQISKKARKTVNSSGCHALNKNSIDILSEDILGEVQDIEHIVKVGKERSACPYYATRSAVRDGQVIVLPYNTILHKATREACGIQLKNSVVIIDEAHNLLEAIGNIYSSEVSGYQLSHAHSQLVQYRDRYQKRFNSKTVLHLGQVIFIVSKLIRMLGGKVGASPEEASGKALENKIFTLSDFVLSAEVDNLNLFKLLEFCKSSKISHKLHGFISRYHTEINISQPIVKNQGIRTFLKEMEKKKSVDGGAKSLAVAQHTARVDVTVDGGSNPFLSVMSFLETLTNRCDDGRILLKRAQTVSKSSLKFLLLNPAAHFHDIVLQARSVIVAGGTMQPTSEFQDQLFCSAGGSVDRISLFSCGHIIPAENILPIALGSGPSGKALQFSFGQRDSVQMVTELGRVLINMCNLIPSGIVCFFPSYDYEKFVFDQFKNSGIIEQIESRKKIFREPKLSSEVDEVLTAYAACIRRSKCCLDSKLTGALMFSVIGGKLSEGLNFSDDLGRCVLVVGLPFPNIKSLELQEQMKYLNITMGPGAGQRHYENLCMKAVNQSIGRAIRHKDDYASVILVDQRYLAENRQAALPAWIQRSLESHDKFSSAFASVRKFFQRRKVSPS